MSILIGTRNPAKFQRYQAILRQYLNADIYSLEDIGVTEVAIEDGITAEENARKKARIYAQLSGLPTLGIDEALAFPRLPQEEQPGIYVRRYAGKEASDGELLSSFLSKIARLPVSQRQAIWTYGLCIALPNSEEFFEQVQVHVLFTDSPRLPLLPGYPLSSLLIDPTLMKPLLDCTPEEEQNRLRCLFHAVDTLLQSASPLVTV